MTLEAADRSVVPLSTDALHEIGRRPDARVPPQRGDGPEPAFRGSACSSRGERVVDGAAHVFAEYGYHGSSLRHIATHVGITHTGLLHHFDSKRDLMGAVVDRLEAHAQHALDRIDELGTDPASFLRALTELWNPSSEPIQLFATLDADVVSHDHPARYRIARLRCVHEHVLEECFARLARRGGLRPAIDPAFAGRCALALVLSHALREKTVRTMQGGAHDDAPLQDLHALVGMFLQEPAEEEQPLVG